MKILSRQEGKLLKKINRKWSLFTCAWHFLSSLEWSVVSVLKVSKLIILKVCLFIPWLIKSMWNFWFLRFSVEDFNSEGRAFFGGVKDKGNKGVVAIVLEDHEREPSSESSRPIVLKQRKDVYRPFPVIQPVFIKHPVKPHKRRPQLESEEWKSESYEEAERRKNNNRKNHNHIKQLSDEEHHFHYVPTLPKYHPINYPDCPDVHPDKVTLVSRMPEIIAEIQLMIHSVVNQIQSA